MNTAQQFDKHADTYDADLNRALSASGESKEYFEQRRIQWLRRCLEWLEVHPHSALDYGCGIGDTAALLAQVFNLNSVIGLDVSERSLELAGRQHGSGACRFSRFQDHTPARDIDLAY